MTDEEKQAIEYIDKIVSDCENRWKQLGYTCNLYDGDEPIPVDVYKTVLNLIEKQQNRIKELETALIDEDYKSRKVIDLMAKDIKEADEFLESRGYLGEYAGCTIDEIIEEYKSEVK